MKPSKGRGSLFVVSAPSGAGKTSLCRKLEDVVPEITHSVSYTTRSPRPDEVDGRDYSFVTEETFRSMADDGEFVEWAEVHGNLYGTSRKRIEEKLEKGMHVILDVDTEGARQLRQTYPDGVSVFILPPSMDALRERLTKRMSDLPDEIERRLRRAADEIRDYDKYNYVIVNDLFEVALKELEAIVLASELRSEGVDASWVKKNFTGLEEV